MLENLRYLSVNSNGLKNLPAIARKMKQTHCTMLLLQETKRVTNLEEIMDIVFPKSRYKILHTSMGQGLLSVLDCAALGEGYACQMTDDSKCKNRLLHSIEITNPTRGRIRLTNCYFSPSVLARYSDFVYFWNSSDASTTNIINGDLNAVRAGRKSLLEKFISDNDLLNIQNHRSFVEHRFNRLTTKPDVVIVDSKYEVRCTPVPGSTLGFFVPGDHVCFSIDCNFRVRSHAKKKNNHSKKKVVLFSKIKPEELNKLWEDLSSTPTWKDFLTELQMLLDKVSVYRDVNSENKDNAPEEEISDLDKEINDYWSKNAAESNFSLGTVFDVISQHRSGRLGHSSVNISKRVESNSWDEFASVCGFDEDSNDIPTRILNNKALAFSKSVLKTCDERSWIFSKEEVEQAIRNTNWSASPGPDKISASLLIPEKAHIDKFVFMINDIFKRAVLTSHIPRDLRTAIMKFIPKGDGKLRPLSLISRFSAILDSMCNARLLELLNRDPSYDHCLGFRENRGCETVFGHCLASLSEAKKKKLVAALLQLDLEAAFNKVSHSQILKQLWSSIMRTNSDADPKFLALFAYTKAWIRNRWVIYACWELRIKRGVPQGSPFATSAFVIAVKINLEKSSNTCKVYCYLYADDLSIILLSENGLSKLEAAVLEVADVVKNTVERDLKMSTAAHKSVFMIFGWGCSAKDRNGVYERVKGHLNFKCQAFCKVLGLWLDDKLQFGKNTESLQAYVARACFGLRYLMQHGLKFITARSYVFGVRNKLFYGLFHIPLLSASNMETLESSFMRLARIAADTHDRVARNHVLSILGTCSFQDFCSYLLCWRYVQFLQLGKPSFIQFLPHDLNLKQSITQSARDKLINRRTVRQSTRNQTIQLEAKQKFDQVNSITQFYQSLNLETKKLLCSDTSQLELKRHFKVRVKYDKDWNWEKALEKFGLFSDFF